MTIPAAQSIADHLRRLTQWFLAAWLPGSVLAAALLGFDRWFDAQYALAILPAAPMALAILFLRRHATGALRLYVSFLVPYLLLEWIAEIYYLLYARTHGDDPAVPSMADVCWLLSYVFLIWGGWRVATSMRRLRVLPRDAFLQGAWLAVATAILGWWTYRVIQAHRPLIEAIVMGLYPFLDCLAISTVLIARTRYRGQPLRHFWTVMVVACLAVLGGDVLWLLSRDEVRYSETVRKALVNFGDAGYIQAYLLFMAAIWVAQQLAQFAGAEAAIRRQLRQGWVNALASLPFSGLIILVILVEGGAEEMLHTVLGGSIVALVVTAGLVPLVLKGFVFHKWEKHHDAMGTYCEAFRRRLTGDLALAASHQTALDDLRGALGLSGDEARLMEARVLRDVEEDARSRLEDAQEECPEAQSDGHWQATRSSWLAYIRDLDRQARAARSTSPDIAVAEPRALTADSDSPV